MNNPAYYTRLGAAHIGDSLELLDMVPNNSINLVMTSPPFALQRKKSYGNESQDQFVDWIVPFALKVYDKLAVDGSFVIDLGGAYQQGRPVRSLYNYKVLIAICEEAHFNLAEEFFWYNPAKLPSPIEWVNKRKIRVKDAVNPVWWLTKSDFPKTHMESVLAPYSERMKKLLENGKKYYDPKQRPSGHDISAGFNKDNGGAIPSNLLQYPNTESNSQYLRRCKEAGTVGHPARFPSKLPEFFIKFLTSPGDLVIDIFSGSNTTGATAETLQRRWMAFELSQEYVAASVFRFDMSKEESLNVYERILNTERDIMLPVPEHQISFLSN